MQSVEIFSPSFGNSGHVHVRRRSSSGSRTLPSGLEDPSPIVGRAVEHRAGIEPAFRALQARALPLGDRCIVERTGIEPAAAALQVQLAPLAHASPFAVPTRIELAYRGRQPRILTRGFRDQRVYGGNRTLATRFTNSRATITLRTPCGRVPWRTRTSVVRSSGDCTCRCANGTG